MITEYKAALAYAAGQAVAQRQNMLAIRTIDDLQVSEPYSGLSSSSVYTVNSMDSTPPSRSSSIHTLKRVKAQLGMSIEFAEIEMKLNETGQMTPFEAFHSLCGPYETTDTTSLPRVSWDESARQSSEQTSDTSNLSDLESHRQHNRTRSSSDSISVLMPLAGGYRSLNMQHVTPISTVSIERFEELSMYIALSKGVRAALGSSSFYWNPAVATTISPDQDTLSSTLKLPELFRSVCVCDPKIKGSPVYLRSKHFSIGPRGLRVARCEFLNLPPSLPPQQDEDSFTLSCRPSGDGRPLYVLEYATNLFSQESGLRTWVLAAQMDFTEVIYKLTASMVEQVYRMCHVTTEVAVEEHEAASGQPILDDFPNPPGCSIDWLSFIEPRQKATACSSDYIDITPESMAQLRLLLHRIRSLHQRCFTLSTSSNKAFWQISWASPALACTPDDVRVGFSHTDPEVLGKLEDSLGSDEPRAGRYEVRWGAEGSRTWVWCIPMFREKLESWMCFLVGEEERDLMAGWCW